MLIGPKIKKQRLKLGITQKELADKVGISKSLISSYETGRKRPGFEKLLILVEELKFTPNELLGLEYTIKDEEENYLGLISKEELFIIREIRKSSKLHKQLLEDPKRTIELICRKIF